MYTSLAAFVDELEEPQQQVVGQPERRRLNLKTFGLDDPVTHAWINIRKQRRLGRPLSHSYEDHAKPRTSHGK